MVVSQSGLSHSGPSQYGLKKCDRKGCQPVIPAYNIETRVGPSARTLTMIFFNASEEFIPTKKIFCVALFFLTYYNILIYSSICHIYVKKSILGNK